LNRDPPERDVHDEEIRMNDLVWRLTALLGKLSVKVHCIAPQMARVDDVFRDCDLILDLGGGGEGVIGRLRGRQVVAVDARKDELLETPTGPAKVVADARNLPFPDRSFEAATAFFFLMYVAARDRRQILEEAYRVLAPGGALQIWDVVIPTPGKRARKTFVVPVRVDLPGRTIRTGYGVTWNGREMSAEGIAETAQSVGFVVTTVERSGHTFHISLVRPAA